MIAGEQGRGWGIAAAGVFAIVAGLGEIIVGVTGNYLGILSKPLESSAVTALVGACYGLGGAFILTSKKWGAALGMALIGAEILGRIYLVTTGVAPSSGPDAIKIAVGAAIALALIGARLRVPLRDVRSGRGGMFVHRSESPHARTGPMRPELYFSID